MKVGARLDHLWTGELTWPDLRAVVQCAEPGTPLAVAVRGKTGGITSEQVLMIRVLDALRSISWQLAGDKTKPQPRPSRIPGVDDDKSQRLGRDPIPLKDFHDWWESQ